MERPFQCGTSVMFLCVVDNGVSIGAAFGFCICHYDNMPIQCTVFFSAAKIKVFGRKIVIFFFFLLNTLIDAVLTSTHNLCFRAKIRKQCLPMSTPVLLYKNWDVRGST